MKFRRRPRSREITPRRHFTARPRSLAAHEVRHAHQLFQAGDFQEAADVFIRLGWAAHRRHLPADAFLMMQAARVQPAPGNGVEAYRIIGQALHWLREDGRRLVLAKLGDQAASTHTSGFNAEAQRVRTFLQQKLPYRNIIGSMDLAVMLTEIPEKCPYRGGSVHLQFAEDQSYGSVMCAYCGCRIISL